MGTKNYVNCLQNKETTCILQSYGTYRHLCLKSSESRNTNIRAGEFPTRYQAPRLGMDSMSWQQNHVEGNPVGHQIPYCTTPANQSFVDYTFSSICSKRGVFLFWDGSTGNRPTASIDIDLAASLPSLANSLSTSSSSRPLVSGKKK
jgi:hypothetical protein